MGWRPGSLRRAALFSPRRPTTFVAGIARFGGAESRKDLTLALARIRAIRAGLIPGRRGVALAQPWRAARRQRARHAAAALYRDAGRADRAATAVPAGQRGLGALRGVRGWPCGAVRAGGAAGLACRRVHLGRRR